MIIKCVQARLIGFNTEKFSSVVGLDIFSQISVSVKKRKCFSGPLVHLTINSCFTLYSSQFFIPKPCTLSRCRWCWGTISHRRRWTEQSLLRYSVSVAAAWLSTRKPYLTSPDIYHYHNHIVFLWLTFPFFNFKFVYEKLDQNKDQ